MRSIETEDLRNVRAQILDVIADAAHAKLAEVTEVFANLRGVQMKLLGERLRRDGLDPGRVQRIEAAKINTEAAGCQF